MVTKNIKLGSVDATGVPFGCLNSQERGLDIAEYLEEEEIPILIENTPKLQKRAFLDCLYDSGSRPEEFLRLSNLDCKIDTMAQY
ncbi:MAG TPA: hypothetical protein VF222_10070 [Nitrososphaeraceae archaeon]